MNKLVYDKVRNEYERRQRESYTNLQIRQQEAYSALKRLREIDDEIKSAGLKYNKMILLGAASSNNIISELQARISHWKAEKGKLLVEAGYPEDYLEISYTCPQCRDTGYISGPQGDEKCFCHKQLLINFFFSKSYLKLTETENFEYFDETLYDEKSDEGRYGSKLSPRENIRAIKEICCRFIENFESPEERNLFFSGPTGVGKTYMSNCIAAELIKKGRTVLYQTAPVLFDVISEYKSRSFKDEDYDESSYKSIFEAELLIIDDMGTETQTFSRYGELLNILNIRQLNDMSRPCKTIISTNIGAKQLHEYYTDRVMSRILGNFERLMFFGADIRNTKR